MFPVLLPALCCLVPAPETPDLAARVDQLVKEGRALLGKGKANEAARKYQEAMAVDPKSSWPVSAMADLYHRASEATRPEHVEEYRQQAEAYANRAIDLNDLDYEASRVLGDLRGNPRHSRYAPSAEARQAFEAAEGHFGAGEYDAAREAYQKALAKDPGYTDAALYLGDCYFAQRRFREAEPFFRKAVGLEPTYGRAWRFLFDCLYRLERWEDLDRAALDAISAEPDDHAAWGRLRQAREAKGLSGLTRFHWPTVGRVVPKPGGKGVEIQVRSIREGQDSLDGALELAVLLVRTACLGDDPNARKALQLEGASPFQQELKAWSSALAVLREHSQGGKEPKVDAAWKQVLDFERAGHLETALFLLAFRSDYRRDFEAWKRQNPKAIGIFIARFGLRP